MSREKKVRDEAYAIWEAEGRPEGRDRDHWRQAEERVAGLKSSKDGDKATAPNAREKKAVAASGGKSASAKPPAKAAATSSARSSKKKL